MDNEKGNVSFFGLLTCIFVGLKLTNHITWSWWWVISPIWLPFAILVVLFTIIRILDLLSGD